jgi:hypothetical protein
MNIFNLSYKRYDVWKGVRTVSQLNWHAYRIHGEIHHTENIVLIKTPSNTKQFDKIQKFLDMENVPRKMKINYRFSKNEPKTSNFVKHLNRV